VCTQQAAAPASYAPLHAIIDQIVRPGATATAKPQRHLLRVIEHDEAMVATAGVIDAECLHRIRFAHAAL